METRGVQIASDCFYLLYSKREKEVRKWVHKLMRAVTWSLVTTVPLVLAQCWAQTRSSKGTYWKMND